MNESKKICPLLSLKKDYNVCCIGEKCAWWIEWIDDDPDFACCALTSIAKFGIHVDGHF